MVRSGPSGRAGDSGGLGRHRPAPDSIPAFQPPAGAGGAPARRVAHPAGPCAPVFDDGGAKAAFHGERGHWAGARHPAACGRDVWRPRLGEVDAHQGQKSPTRPRGARRRALWLVLDRRLRLGYGSAAGVPWGTAARRATWEGWRRAIANGIAHAQRCETPLRCAHIAPESTRDGWA